MRQSTLALYTGLIGGLSALILLGCVDAASSAPVKADPTPAPAPARAPKDHHLSLSAADVTKILEQAEAAANKEESLLRTLAAPNASDVCNGCRPWTRRPQATQQPTCTSKRRTIGRTAGRSS